MSDAKELIERLRDAGVMLAADYKLSDEAADLIEQFSAQLDAERAARATAEAKLGEIAELMTKHHETKDSEERIKIIIATLERIAALSLADTEEPK